MAIRSAQPLDGLFLGDGVSITFTFDITKGPYVVNVGGNNPIGVRYLGGGGPSVSSISVAGTKITITYSSPLSSAVFTDFHLLLIYP